MIFCFSDNGKTFRLRQGFHGRIELKGNATTGYSWRVQRVRGNSVEIGQKWEYTPDATYLVGGGGTYSIDFQVVDEGRTYIYLVYDSPFYPRPIGFNFVLIIDGIR